MKVTVEGYSGRKADESTCAMRAPAISLWWRASFDFRHSRLYVVAHGCCAHPSVKREWR
jgi:hypothetical protein